MGWPRKNNDMRLYKERDGSIIVVLTANGTNGAGNYNCIANVYAGKSPSLCGTSVSPAYLQWKRRIEWSELANEWRNAIAQYMSTDPDYKFDPANVRGFWRIGNQPKIGA